MNHKTHYSWRTGLALAACGLALLAGCGSKLDGTYYGKFMGQPLVEWEFKPGNKVNISGPAGKFQVDYELSGKEVRIKMPDGTVMLATIDNDGCLDFGGMMGKACKKK